MSDESMIFLSTRKCIVTGRDATYWCGHVKAKTLGGKSHPTVSVLAGFASMEIANAKAASQSDSCYGDWKPEHGIIVEFNTEDGDQ